MGDHRAKAKSYRSCTRCGQMGECPRLASRSTACSCRWLCCNAELTAFLETSSVRAPCLSSNWLSARWSQNFGSHPASPLAFVDQVLDGVPECGGPLVFRSFN